MSFSAHQLVRRLRFELARRLNRLRRIDCYRWTRADEAGRRRIVLRRADGSERELRLRANSTDFSVFLQIFDGLQYDTRKFARNVDIRARYDAIMEAGGRPLIIDAGANIGLATLYYRDTYPEAIIIAVEPEPRNFAELLHHLDGDDLLLPLNAAISSKDELVQVADPGEGEWGFRTSPATSNAATTVPAYSIESLIRLAAERCQVAPFILKIDIEGFESRLFDGEVGKSIDAFYAVLIEPHDWLFPKQRTAAGFLKVLDNNDRDFLILGENILSVSNADPRAVPATKTPANKMRTESHEPAE
jgi:FkbM family methyltransferase